MTNQQLKAHCEGVIANPQDHSEMVIAMAKALLPCLDSVPVGRVNRGAVSECNEYPDANVYCIHEYADWENFQDGFLLYTAPPVPEMKPIELPEPEQSEDESWWYREEAVHDAIRAAGYEVKS